MTENISNKINRRWTTRDIMVTAIISVVLVAVYIPLTYLTGWAAAFPFILAGVLGIYFWPVILVTYLIRKPGVAIFSTAVSMLVTVPFTPYGIEVLLHILTIGVPIEVIFLIGRYKTFKLWYLMLSGAIGSLVTATLAFVMLGLGNISFSLQIVFFGEAIVSGALLGGLLAKLIGDLVFKTGIISTSDKVVQS